MSRLVRDIGLLTVGLVAVNLLWRTVRYALCFPIWGDEAFVVTSLYERDFAGLFRPLEYAQIVPLMFMWVELAVVRLAGLSEYALRLAPYLAGLASILLFRRFAAKIFDRWSALLAVGMLAAAYYPVRHAAEVKPYAGDLLVSLALTYLAWSVTTLRGSARRWLALIVLAGVSVWLSYPAVFVAGAAGLYLLYQAVRSGGRRRFVGAAAYGVLVAGSFVAMYLVYAGPHAEAAAHLRAIGTWEEAWPPVTRPWLLPWWFLKIHTGNLLAYPVGGKNFGSTATFLLVIAGCVALWRRGRRDLLLLLLGPLVLMFLAAALRLYPYGTSARIAQHMAPAFCLLAGLGLAAALRALVRPRGVPNAFRIAAGVLMIIALVGIANDIRRPYKKEASLRNRRAVRDLVAKSRPEDEWIFYNALRDVPYAPNLVDFKGSGAALRYHVRRFAPVPVRWGPKVDDLSLKPDGRILFIVYYDNDVPFPEQLFESYFRDATRRLGRPRKWPPYIFTSPKDPKRGELEQLEVYEFPPAV
ncbi:MAG: ArnT family glycosyltransferase [Planctomycetota bacterium]